MVQVTLNLSHLSGGSHRSGDLVVVCSSLTCASTCSVVDRLAIRSPRAEIRYRFSGYRTASCDGPLVGRLRLFRRSPRVWLYFLA